MYCFNLYSTLKLVAPVHVVTNSNKEKRRGRYGSRSRLYVITFVYPLLTLTQPTLAVDGGGASEAAAISASAVQALLGLTAFSYLTTACHDLEGDKYYFPTVHCRSHCAYSWLPSC